MDKRNREKWIRRVKLGLLIAFGIIIGLNYWTTFEKTKLNQRYERVIEQYESELDSLIELNQDVRSLVGHLKNLVDH